MPRTYRAAIVTVSDSVAGGAREDVSGPTVARILESAGWEVHSAEIVPDDFSLLRERLSALGSDTELDAVFTTGGTGIGPRDRTPEATTSVMERSVPGLAELMRRAGVEKTPLAALSRAVVGVKGKVLLVNLPGSPSGAEDSLRAILDVLPHAVAVVRGEEVHGPAASAPPPEAAAPAASEPPAPSEPASVPETAPSSEPPSGE